ncbi:MAG: hypothetical protein MRY83_22900 [Flavobacteriales bacterium]|nr:hypothetical protein [Flavobacteriales bacterium]
MNLIWDFFTRNHDWQGNFNSIPKYIYSTLSNNNLLGRTELIGKSWYRNMEYLPMKNYKGFDELIDNAKMGKTYNNFAVALTDQEETWYFALTSFPKSHNSRISVKITSHSAPDSNLIFDTFRHLAAKDLFDTSYVHNYDRFHELCDITREDAYFENSILDRLAMPGVYWCNYWSENVMREFSSKITGLKHQNDLYETLEMKDGCLLRICEEVQEISKRNEEDKMIEIANFFRENQGT